MTFPRASFALFAALAVTGAFAQDAKLRSEITTHETVDVWVLRVGNEGSRLSLEARNRGDTDVRVRGKIVTFDSNTGTAVKQCDYDLRVPTRTFVSKLTKCSLSGADALQATIEELVPENQ